MNRRISLFSLPLAVAIMAAGCGSATRQTTAPATPSRPLSLATSLTTTTGTWAAAVMGGSAASHNNFWQLFVRPAGTSTWRLATPPGVASNGGLLLAGLGSGSVLAGFRPSQDLTYSPLAISKNDGKSWSPSLLDASLADVPGALAAAPGDGGLLALLTDGTTEISSPAGAAWTRLVTRRALAASPAGTRCRPGALTATAFSPSGQPMLATACGRLGTAGILTLIGGKWQLTSPAMPAAFAHQVITVARLSTTGESMTALLVAGTGTAAHLLAVSSRDGGRHWTLSPTLPLNGATLTSTSAGPGHSLAVTMTPRRAAVTASGAGAWRPLPALPPGTATLAPGPSGGWDALAAHGTQLTIWQAAPGAQAWARTQVLKVPVPYGSSG